MEKEHPDYRIIVAAALGAAGGLLLANYLRRAKDQGKPLSEHLAALVKIIEQFEDSGSDETESLKESIGSILTTLESSYGDTEK